MVGSHASAISYVIPHILCNCSTVEWVIFWNSCLNFTYKVGTHIRCLGIDPSAVPCAHSNGETTKGASGEYNKHEPKHFQLVVVDDIMEQQHHNRKPDESHSHHAA